MDPKIQAMVENHYNRGSDPLDKNIPITIGIFDPYQDQIYFNAVKRQILIGARAT